MKGLAYGRLSRDEDSEQESLKNQEDLVVGYMNKNNHTVIEIAMDDNYTGMNYDRPGIKRMFELARERRCRRPVGVTSGGVRHSPQRSSGMTAATATTRHPA